MKTTKNRTQIIELLKKEDKAFTAQQIHEVLGSMDLATIYRNLNKFVEEGIVRELRLYRGESMYEINHDGHEHAVCSNCGKVRHIHIDKSKIKDIIELDDFDIEDVEIHVKGTCK